VPIGFDLQFVPHKSAKVSKKPGDEAGLFGSADLSAEQAGRIDDACGRQQPNRDQSKLHDLILRSAIGSIRLNRFDVKSA
jgi:hypothetical protein